MILCVALALRLSLVALPGYAASGTVVADNGTTARPSTDTYHNFIIIDANHPITAPRTITSFGYYAANLNPFRFVVVNGAQMVTYLSPEITPSTVGQNTYTPANPIVTSTGDNVGLYFASTGTVPFAYGGAPDCHNAGHPTVGETLPYAGCSDRKYSFVAYGTFTPTGKEECKDRRYQMYSDPTTSQPFRNQGQCIAYVNHSQP